MRKSVKAELRLLREFAHDIMPRIKCPFCKTPLLENVDENKGQFGHRNHSPIRVKVTLHHKNGNHADNSPKNRVWAHHDCHRRYHAKQLKRSGGKFAVTNGHGALKKIRKTKLEDGNAKRKGRSLQVA